MTGPVGVTIDLPTVICQERKVTRERVPPARLQHPAGASLTIWWCPFNTGTTIVTFLMVFLIQNTQNRETRIVALKLDELLRGVEGARTGLVELDHMSDDDLELVRQEFARMRDKYAPLVDDDLAHVERELKARKRRG